VTQTRRAGSGRTDRRRGGEARRVRGASAAQLAESLALQRHAQWRLDFVNAENSMGFHAPQETARLLGEAIDYARHAQLRAGSAAQPSRVGSAPM
jgi:nitrite reductase (cytochrome c-552)